MAEAGREPEAAAEAAAAEAEAAEAASPPPLPLGAITIVPLLVPALPPLAAAAERAAASALDVEGIGGRSGRAPLSLLFFFFFSSSSAAAAAAGAAAATGRRARAAATAAAEAAAAAVAVAEGRAAAIGAGIAAAVEASLLEEAAALLPPPLLSTCCCLSPPPAALPALVAARLAARRPEPLNRGEDSTPAASRRFEGSLLSKPATTSATAGSGNLAARPPLTFSQGKSKGEDDVDAADVDDKAPPPLAFFFSFPPPAPPSPSRASFSSATVVPGANRGSSVKIWYAIAPRLHASAAELAATTARASALASSFLSPVDEKAARTSGAAYLFFVCGSRGRIE